MTSLDERDVIRAEFLRKVLIWGFLDRVDGRMVLRFVDAEIDLEPDELDLVQELHASLED